ncbi:MAG: hypothetical protein KDC92_15845 [Bacteroidetes bacterium]|nr:hypothetical protein [Bacteroidota bacterium]
MNNGQVAEQVQAGQNQADFNTGNYPNGQPQQTSQVVPGAYIQKGEVIKLKATEGGIVKSFEAVCRGIGQDLDTNELRYQVVTNSGKLLEYSHAELIEREYKSGKNVQWF